MAALPEDDAPTVTGTPGDRRVSVAVPRAADLDEDGDDTTSADVGPPAPRSEPPPEDTGDPDEEEQDRTVQQHVAPPLAARRPPALRRKPSEPAISSHVLAPATVPGMASGSPSTQPSATRARPASSDELAIEVVQDFGASDDDSDESVTETAPRLDSGLPLPPGAAPAPNVPRSPSAPTPPVASANANANASSSGSAGASASAGAGSARRLPITIPGSVEIRTVEHDELLDETEVRTEPGHVTFELPTTLRGVGPASPPSAAPATSVMRPGRATGPAHGPSQPPPPPRPAAGRPPSSTPPAPPYAFAHDDDEDEDDEGVTTKGLVPHADADVNVDRARAAPTTLPHASPPTLSSKAPSTQPSAGVAPRSDPALEIPIDAVEPDEPPTRPGVEGEAPGARADESEGEPPTRPGIEGIAEPPTRPGIEGAIDPATSPRLDDSPTSRGVTEIETAKRISIGSYANDADDESVTTRGRAVEPYDGDSVTTQAPAVPLALIEAASRAALANANIDDTTGGTTQRVHKMRPIAPSSPADSEAESITTQAPGPLTNILRVIASESSPDAGTAAQALLDDDEPPENRTAVMANAPLKRVIAELGGASGAAGRTTSSMPPIRPTGGPLHHGPQTSAAANLAPASESGLRVARGDAGAGERASLGALGVGVGVGGGGPVVGDAHSSGIARAVGALASDGSVSAPVDVHALANRETGFPHAPAGAQPSVHDVDLGRGPRYGLLVGIVALISVVVPVSLFVVLRRPPETVTPGAPSEAASELEKHDAALRAKGIRGKNGVMVAASALASASASAAPGASASGSASNPSSRSGPGGTRGGFPFRR